MALRFLMDTIVFDQDIALYYKYGSLLLAGRPVAAEYPELAVVFWGVAAYLSGSLANFRFIYPILMLPFGCLTVYLLQKIGVRFGSSELGSVSALMYALSPFTAIFWMFKFDEVAAAFLTVGLYALAQQRQRLTGVSAAIGFLIKWLPALVLPSAVIFFARKSTRAALELIGIFLGAVAAIVFSYHAIWGGSYTFAYSFHALRNINGESIYYLFEYLLTGNFIIPSGSPTPIYLTNTLVSSVMILAGIAWLVLLVKRTKASNLVYLSSLTVLLFLLVNKIYSVQYVLWFLPAFLTCFMQLRPKSHGMTVWIVAITLLEVFNYAKISTLSEWWIVASACFWISFALAFSCLLAQLSNLPTIETREDSASPASAIETHF